MLIAIPSDAPGGLQAPVSSHFGHCHAFTLVEVEDGKIRAVKMLPNEGHVQGGCMAPVMLLKGQGVQTLLAGGMGPRPLAGFQQQGIAVHFKEDAETVSQAVELFLAGGCRAFGQAQTCGGGEGHDCGSHGHAEHQTPVDRPALDGPPVVMKNRVVSMEFRLTDGEGNVVDSTDGRGPTPYLHGHGQILPGLERALEGLTVGDCRTVTLQPDQAFGMPDPEHIFTLPRAQVPGEVAPGEVLHARQADGHVVSLTVLAADDVSVTLDANHPLAGKAVTFEVTIRKVEAATEQELAHGHAH